MLVWLVCGTFTCSIRMLLLLRSTVGVVGGRDSSCSKVVVAAEDCCWC